MYVIVGLGNPGDKYARTRHNVGFDVIDLLAEQNGISVTERKHKALIGKGRIAGQAVILVKPQTFMNLSGESVEPIAAYFKIPTENILVIYDDIDIPIGSLRIRKSGSPGTHNGMRNVTKMLGTENFPRVRIGTKPEGDYEILSYVLSDVKKADEPKFKFSVNEAVSAADEFIRGKKIDDVMCKFNGHSYTE